MNYLRFFLYSAFFWASIVHAQLYKDRADYLRSVQYKKHFSFDVDRDSNGFPDAWFRETKEGFQDYHSILINKDGRDDDKGLRIVFSGGKAGLHTAALRLNLRFAYNISLFYKGDNLNAKNRHQLRFGLKAYDKAQNVIQEEEMLVDTFPGKWTQSRTLRIERLNPNTDSCVMYIHLSGRPAGRSRLWVDDLKIVPSPRIHIETKRSLNIYAPNEDMAFTQTIEGTIPGENYQFKRVIRDFMDHVIDSSSRSILGKTSAIVIKDRVPLNDPEVSGVYYIRSTLEKQGRVLVQVDEIVARDSSEIRDVNDPSFGVILGRPVPPFDDLLISMKRLGVAISKLDLLPKDFAFSRFSSERGLVDLNQLLRIKAPDAGYQFIGVVNPVPEEADKHPRFEINPATHVIETFATHMKKWQEILDHLLFLYGNVIRDWQIGDDAVAIPAAKIEEGRPVIDFLKKKADWSKLLLPRSWDEVVPDSSMYVPAEMSQGELEALLKKRKTGGMYVTLQLNSVADTPNLRILENLVKKVTILKYTSLENKKSVVEKLFIDRLNDPLRGLMTTDYKPLASFFAVKTLVAWFQDSEFLGRLTLEDKDIVNYVFQKGNQSFLIIWRKKKIADGKFFLGDSVTMMDLMGNKTKLEIESDDSFYVPLSTTPIFIVTPYPELMRTILSLQLQKRNLQSAVKLQDQHVFIKNHFPEKANFDFSVNYPKDWLTQDNVYATELKTDETNTHKVRLSPSSLSPSGVVKVVTDLNISLEKKHHHVKIYREDYLNTDVEVKLAFFRAEGGLKMDITLEFEKSAPRLSSFIVSAHFNDGDHVEAFYKDLKPGEASRKSLFVRNGLAKVGEQVSVEVKENLGNRYINRSFPISLKY